METSAKISPVVQRTYTRAILLGKACLIGDTINIFLIAFSNTNAVTLDILAQIILNWLRFAQECFKVKLISKSHNRAITRRYGLAIEASYSPEYRSLLSRNVFVCVNKLKQRRYTDFLFRKILLGSNLLAHQRKPYPTTLL